MKKSILSFVLVTLTLAAMVLLPGCSKKHNYVSSVKSWKPLVSEGISATYETVVNEYLSSVKWEQRGSSDMVFVAAKGKLTDVDDSMHDIELLIEVTPSFEMPGISESAYFSIHGMWIDGEGYYSDDASHFITCLFHADKLGLASIADFFVEVGEVDSIVQFYAGSESADKLNDTTSDEDGYTEDPDDSSEDKSSPSEDTVFTYEIIDGGIYIKGYNSNDSDVIIPSKINDIPVVGISTGAFSDNIYVRSVTIPDSVWIIGSGAFQDCTSLSSVVIGSGILSIEAGAFQRCISLTDVTIGNNEVQINYSAFYFCMALSEASKQRILQINPDVYLTIMP